LALIVFSTGIKQVLCPHLKVHGGVMSNRIVFYNDSGRIAQVAVTINDQGVSNFQIPINDSDSTTTADEGDIVWFWWRNDGTQCTLCNDPNPPCSRNEIDMPDKQVTVNLTTAKKQSI
jgi:hypothetical protein